MTVATKVLPITKTKTEASDFVPVALFSGSVVSPLSLAVMLADLFSAVEWF